MISLYDLVVEVTRNCNMNCPHCLRGEPQRLTMKRDILRRFLRQVDNINQLVITGGEPSLVPHRIIELIEEIQFAGVSVDMFYMVTNAKRITQPFLDAIQRLEWLVSDPGSSCVVWSNDRFHDDEKPGLYRLEEWMECLESHCGPKDAPNVYGRISRWDMDPDYILEMGRAKRYVSARKQVEPGYFTLKEESYGGAHADGTMYLNCKGAVLSCCDLSYEVQDEKEDNEFLIGNVHDPDFNLYSALRSYPRTVIESDDAEEDEVANAFITEVVPVGR